MHRTADLFSLNTLPERHTGNVGVLTLVVLFIQTIVMTIVLIVFPLLYFHREGLAVPNRGRYVGYFAALGLGFMLIEIAFMQKLSLYLGHPTYSISVVLTSMLLFSGIGSFVSCFHTYRMYGWQASANF